MYSITDKLYRINDALTALAYDLGVEWSGDEQQDLVLNELTHLVAEGFGIGKQLTVMDPTQELHLLKIEIDRLQQKRDALLRQIADEKGLAYAIERLLTLRDMLDHLDESEQARRMTRGVEIHIKLRSVHEGLKELEAQGKDTTEAKPLLIELTRRVASEVFKLDPDKYLLFPYGKGASL